MLLLISSKSQSKFKIDNESFKSSTCKELFRIKIDNKLSLSADAQDLCKKANRKIHALARVTPYMTLSKRRILLNAFFRSLFSHCPLV